MRKTIQQLMLIASAMIPGMIYLGRMLHYSNTDEKPFGSNTSTIADTMYRSPFLNDLHKDSRVMVVLQDSLQSFRASQLIFSCLIVFIIHCLNNLSTPF